jgi:hypothetical protein
MRKETKIFVGSIMVAAIIFGNSAVFGIMTFGALWMIFGDA